MTTNQSFILSEKKDVFTSSMPSRNELLGQLLSIPGVAKSLLPELRIVSLTVNQVLYEQADKINVVYFPLDCVMSNLAMMEDGTTLETQMVGREGLVGISAVLGGGVSRNWTWVTIGGNAIQVDAALLDKLFVQNETSLKALLKFYGSLITQVSQRCVCNTRHTIMERLCCWLLMIHDRVGEHKLSLTQEMIASRVGARRAGITVAAGTLQGMGAIEYRRGQLHIAKRELLERTVCECYGAIQGEFKTYPPPTLVNPFTINKKAIDR